jgi:hypothetical protein
LTYDESMKWLLLGSIVVFSGCASSKESGAVDSTDASADVSTAHDAGHVRDADAPSTFLAETSAVDVSDALNSEHPATDLVGVDGGNFEQASDAATETATSAVVSDTTAREGDGAVSEGGVTTPGALPLVTFTFDGAVYTVPADGSSLPENVSVRIERTGGADRWLVPSPSGTVFALSSARSSEDAEVLVRANADFSVVTTVLAGGSPVYLEGMPAIVDSGDVIVFSATGGTHERDLFVTRESNGSWSAPKSSPPTQRQVSTISPVSPEIRLQCCSTAVRILIRKLAKTAVVA